MPANWLSLGSSCRISGESDRSRGTKSCKIGKAFANRGVVPGRSPKDKGVVKNPASENDIWWGPVNIPFDEHTFQINRQRALDYLNTRERLYCFDGFAGWDPKYRIKVRVICSRPYHTLFMHTMLIYNAGSFPANRLTTGMGSAPRFPYDY